MAAKQKNSVKNSVKREFLYSSHKVNKNYHMTTEVLEYITEVVRTTLWCLYRFFCCCCCPLWTDSSIFILRKRAAWTFIKTTTFVFHGRKNVYGFGANLKDLMINLEENIPLKICYCKSSKLWPIWWLSGEHLNLVLCFFWLQASRTPANQ